MQTKLLIRADDFGLTESTSLGVLKAHRDGIVQSTSVMVNTPGSQRAVQLLKDVDSLCVGLHVNIVLGKPVSESNLITTLVDEKGEFKSSSFRRALNAQGLDPLENKEEVLIEVEAQIMEFQRLFGHLPEYIDTHAIQSKTLDDAVSEMAKKYDLCFLSYYGGESYGVNQLPYKVTKTYDCYMQDVEPRNLLSALSEEILSHELVLLVLHPGYLDYFVYTNSNLLWERVKDIEALSHLIAHQWIKENQVELISHRHFKNK